MFCFVSKLKLPAPTYSFCCRSVNVVKMSIFTDAVTESLYNDTAKKLREITALDGISGLLGWDEMVMLPPGSGGSRGDQKAVLAGIIYDKKTDPELASNLTKLMAVKDSLTDVQAANVRDAYKMAVRESAVPKELAQR